MRMKATKSTKKKEDVTKKATTKQREQVSSLRAVRFLLAGYVLLFLLLQLFTFEKFPALLESAGVAGGWSHGVAIGLVVVELLALPYLLQMKLPGRVRRASLVSGVVAMLTLTVLEVIAFTHEQTVMFGATFGLPGGSWSLLFLAALWTLLAWSVFGGRGPSGKKKSL